MLGRAVLLYSSVVDRDDFITPEMFKDDLIVFIQNEVMPRSRDSFFSIKLSAWIFMESISMNNLVKFTAENVVVPLQFVRGSLVGTL